MFKKKEKKYVYKLVQDDKNASSIGYDTEDELRKAYPDYKLYRDETIYMDNLHLKKDICLRFAYKYGRYNSYGKCVDVIEGCVYLFRKDFLAMLKKVSYTETVNMLPIIYFNGVPYTLSGREKALLEELKKPHKSYTVKGTDHPYYFVINGKAYNSDTTNYWLWLSENLFPNNPPLWLLEEYNGKEYKPEKEDPSDVMSMDSSRNSSDMRHYGDFTGRVTMSCNLYDTNRVLI